MKRAYDNNNEVFSALALALVNGHALADQVGKGALNELQWELVCEAITHRINAELRPIMKRCAKVLGECEYYIEYSEGLLSNAECLYAWLGSLHTSDETSYIEKGIVSNILFQMESLERKLREIHCPIGSLGCKGCLMYLAD